MARFFFQYLAIYNKKMSQKQKNCTQEGSKFSKLQINVRTIVQTFN